MDRIAPITLAVSVGFAVPAFAQPCSGATYSTETVIVNEFAGEQFGVSVCDIGDFDGDGVPDLAVGARNADIQGAFDIVLLNTDGTVKSQSRISELQGGFPFPLSNNANFGEDLVAIGDVNADGVVDLAVKSQEGDSSGTVYIIFMNSDATVQAATRLRAANNAPQANYGSGLAPLGDFDGDGVPDLAVGSSIADDTGFNTGAMEILLLNSDGTIKSRTRTNGASPAMTGQLGTGDAYGSAIANLGDLDGDGIVDIAVGAFSTDSGSADTGAVYVSFLNADGTVREINRLDDTTPGLSTLLMPGDKMGEGMDFLGDLDGDGLVEIMTGADGVDAGGPDRGGVLILELTATGDLSEATLIADDGPDAPSLGDSDQFGFGLAAIGDLDGDGLPEIAAGAFDDTFGENAGAVHILFSGANLPAITEQPACAIADVRGSAVFSVGTDSGNDVQWFRDGVPLFEDPGKLEGTTSGVLVISNVQTSDIGVYAARVTSPGCSVAANSEGAVLAVRPGDPADQNNDGACTPADFNAWILNYNLCQ